MVGHWWQGVILIVVVHMIGLGIVRSFTRIIKDSGFLVDGWGRMYPLLRYYGRTGEKVSMARLGAK